MKEKHKVYFKAHRTLKKIELKTTSYDIVDALKTKFAGNKPSEIYEIAEEVYKYSLFFYYYSYEFELNVKKECSTLLNKLLKNEYVKKTIDKPKQDYNKIIAYSIGIIILGFLTRYTFNYFNKAKTKLKNKTKNITEHYKEIDNLLENKE